MEIGVNQTYISLDLETTGLDAEKDRIVEIGAIKFEGKEILDTFHTLVNPHCPFPYRIRLLTGITAEELETAPSFSAVAARLFSFVGNYPIVGQNINFDLNFLRSQGLSLPNAIYDTIEIANMLLPQLFDHSLPMLAEHLEIPSPVHHRALADAITAQEVFLALLDRTSELDLSQIVEINRLTMTSDWPWRSLFLDLERSKMGKTSLWDNKEAWEADFALPATDLAQMEPLIPDSIFKPLDSTWLTTLISNEGPLAKAFPAFEYRPGQASMMQGIAKSIEQ